jgi:2-polyprenyl-3-methyl-5-hydroxy-6-metoxy-1,4-benzoquinol methylase
VKYSSKDEAQQDHIDNYRSDGVQKGKGTQHSADHHRAEFLLTNTPKESYVLDVGVNGGTIALPLVKLGCYVKGIDIVPELVEKAKERGIFAEIGEAENLEFPDNKFDVVICSEVLEHLYDPLPAIEEAYRVLKPGGRYIITVPHPQSLMAEGKLGDYHQQNFSGEIIDTLFHSVFEKGNVKFKSIPYTKRYCRVNGIDPNRPQWLGLVAVK